MSDSRAGYHPANLPATWTVEDWTASHRAQCPSCCARSSHSHKGPHPRGPHPPPSTTCRATTPRHTESTACSDRLPGGPFETREANGQCTPTSETGAPTLPLFPNSRRRAHSQKSCKDAKVASKRPKNARRACASCPTPPRSCFLRCRRHPLLRCGRSPDRATSPDRRSPVTSKLPPFAPRLSFTNTNRATVGARVCRSVCHISRPLHSCPTIIGLTTTASARTHVHSKTRPTSLTFSSSPHLLIPSLPLPPFARIARLLSDTDWIAYTGPIRSVDATG
jgi:hypothetical protein